MAAALAAQGTTVAQHLQALYQRYGHFVYRSGYFIADKPQYAQAVFDRLRHAGQYPTSVGGLKVVAVRDLGTGLDTSQPGGKALLPWTPGEHAPAACTPLPAGAMRKGISILGLQSVAALLCLTCVAQWPGAAGRRLHHAAEQQLHMGTWAHGHMLLRPLTPMPLPISAGALPSTCCASLHCMCPPACAHQHVPTSAAWLTYL
jgi:hypothetical protein